MEIKPKKTVRKLTRSETFEVYELLKKVGVKKPDGIYEYKPGWSDIAVAKSIGDGIPHWGVQYIRLDQFGKTKAPNGSKAAQAEKRLQDLEDQYLSLLKRVISLESGAFN